MDLVDWAGNSGNAAGSAVQCCATKSRSTKGKGVCPAELGLKVFLARAIEAGLAAELTGRAAQPTT